MSGKVKIAPVKGGEAIEVWSIDAKEILAGGEYVLVSEPTLTSETKKEVTSVQSMTSKKLDQLVEENGLVIEGFDKMNLPQKREAVALALSAPKAVEEVAPVEVVEEVTTEVDDI